MAIGIDRMKILVGYNGTPFAKAAIDDLARAGLPEHADVLVVTVAELCFATVAADDPLDVAYDGQQRIERVFPKWKSSLLTVTGSAAGEILAASKTFEPDLIILGESQNGVSDERRFLGATAQRIVTEATCSTRIARKRARRRSGGMRLVVGFDGSSGAKAAIRSIASRQWQPMTEVHLLSVADSSVIGSIGRFLPQMEDKATATRFASRWAETLASEPLALLGAAGLSASLDIRTGAATPSIVEYAEQWGADCVYVGPHCSGTSFERFMLGSVSAGVAARAGCSVEIVRPKVKA